VTERSWRESIERAGSVDREQIAKCALLDEIIRSAPRRSTRATDSIASSVDGDVEQLIKVAL
jgi:hypothetical protein